ncbi:hypothetical protein [Methylocaldum sp.]|uniref:hypothetical protein n=1 Tax=Methylocaldum sp. TaxID=1969727 RepID=UPI002D6B554B|nr:hypothetical protein [Methylocaldum sp.]HYE34929.1 hypothetical protein [Methylocaldum sp.]
MKKHDLTKAIFTALLLASPLAGAESQYPAADFEPVVISQDADLIAKHSEAAKERALTIEARPDADSSTSSASSVEQSSSGAPAAKAENPLVENYPIGLIVLALAGFIFWSSKQSGSKVQTVQHNSIVVSEGPTAETGVAKYMKNLPASAKAAAAAAETGVAKYLKNLPAPTKVAAAETGVAKYLKNI